ncbi:S9 family peptidase [Steroidobacter sp.]|uniref:S9 family peptidase n=1 Tax=Steroidobacter sp. TaxID=1978227 RepID=UPI001A56DE80|nr:prolyl oligopeptidase family serine peptidase [Steroidobacter sp.]MBL8268323.1 S9 family peptidase [Steroidobacter sp.]
MSRMSILVGSLLLNTFAATAAMPSAVEQPLSVADTVNSRQFVPFEPLNLSADGKWIAYTLIERTRVPVELDPLYANTIARSGATVDAKGTDVWVVDARGGSPRNISNGQGNSWRGRWSPDGRLLAFFSDRTGSAALWVWDRERGQSRPLSTAITQGVSMPIWSPDGKTIVTSALTQGLMVEQAALLIRGQQQTPVGETSATAYRSARAAEVFGAVSSDASVALSVPADPPITDLLAIDVVTGEPRYLAKRVGLVNNYYSVSPDGRRLVYMLRKPALDPRSQQRIVDIVVVSLVDGQAKTVANNVKGEFSMEISWSPDSRRVAYPITGPDAPSQLAIVEMDGGEPRVFDTGGDKSGNSGGVGVIPLWSEQGDRVTVIADGKLWLIQLADGKVRSFATDQVLLRALRRQTSGRYESADAGRSISLLVRDPVTFEEGLAALDLVSGKLRQAKLERAHYGGSWDRGHGVDVSADGRLSVAIRESASEAPDLWAANVATGKRQRITQINPAFDRVKFGASRLISWSGTRGEKLQGALLLPPGHRDGQRHPLVLDVYAGSYRSESVHRFGLGLYAAENSQLLATRGYAVLYPDIPSSPGNPLRGIADNIEAAVQQAVALGYADPSRLGITGLSYGGYSTLSAIISYPERFAAAIERAGPSNLTSMYGAFTDEGRNYGVGWLEEGQGGMHSNLWEQRDLYVRNSPVLFLDRVKTPLLIIHGTADPIVPTSETGQVFVGLRRLNQAVEYVRYHGEGHEEFEWSGANQIDYWERVLRWFEHYLQRPN